MDNNVQSAFAWTDFYTEFADRLLLFKDERGKLLEIIKNAYEQLNLKYPFVEKDGSPFEDVCPFTVFGCFNKGITTENRIAIMDVLGKQIGVQKSAPQEFNGVPFLNNLKAWFFRNKDKRNDDDILNLWSLFEAGIKYADNPSEDNQKDFIENFNMVRDQPIIDWNISIGLFWIRPYSYLNLDEKNRKFLFEQEPFASRLSEIGKLKQLPKADEYLQFIEPCKEIFESPDSRIHSFPELSNNAWIYSQKSKTDNGNRKKENSSQPIIPERRERLHLNTILYGPPGTGKTYSLAKYAISIIEEISPEQVDEEIITSGYENIHKRFKKYRAEGRIDFTTFHQSYSYEDFIEGIRPVMNDDESNNELRYDIIPGIFQKFCENARQNVISSGELKNLLNDNPTVWKVSLGGAGESPLKKSCFENNCIRIGWNEDPEFVENIDPDKDHISQRSYKILFDFEQGMKKGDLVVSLYNQTTLDAVGIITGDYEYDKDLADHRRKRDVKWLFTGKTLDISKLNDNVVLTLSTVYRLHRITPRSLLDAISTYIPEDIRVQNKTQNHVFVIDEINRGNISKIFGELITLIEPEKRIGAKEETDIRLPYSRSNFGVPSNVFILGTMNTADRSIALMDTALRRRFMFIEMMPDPAILERLNNGQPLIVSGTEIDVLAMLETLNKRIQLLYDREHTLGHAYFMDLVKENSISKLADIFKNRILPLLQEYFFDDVRKIRMILGDNQTVNEAWQFINATTPEPGLFGSNSDDIPEDLSFYEINDAAFMRPEAYIKIYSQYRTRES